MPRAFQALLIAVVIASASCSKCGRTAAGGQDLTALLTKDCEAALVVPRIGSLGPKLKILERLKVASFVAQLQGFGGAEDYSAALVAQLGIDPRSAEAIAQAGIDPARGLAVVLVPPNLAYSVVAVADEQRFAQFIERLAAQRLGAAAIRRSEQGGLKLTEVSTAPGAPPRLAYAFRDRHAFLAAEQSAAKLLGWAQLSSDASLASDSTLKASVERLPTGRDALVLVPPASSLVGRGKVAGATAALTLDERSLDVVVDVPFPGMTDALRLLEPSKAVDLLPYLPADAFLAGRISGDPTAAAGFTGMLLGPHLSRAFSEAGFDVKTEILDNLKPGSAFAISLAPEVNLGGGVPELDVRQTNPFRFVHLSAIAEVREPAKASATLEKVAPIGPRFGARIETAERSGQRVFLTHYAQGEGVHFAAAGNKVVMAAPIGRLDQLLAAVAAHPDPKAGALPNPALRDALRDKGLSVVLDLHRLAESVRALPPEAWGVGGFAIRNSSLRWLDATHDLEAVTASLSAKQSAAQARVTLHFQPAGAEGSPK